ncbi:MAG: HAD family hydrolase [Chitinivibrionales bacterium]|nr:HAD family hydrolase [Chitinivibrionales bacterium]
MARQRLYIVHGMGNDAVGLVCAVTKPVADIGGNIVDLRQDVLHGLFTVFMVVDLSPTDVRIEEFSKTIDRIGEDTGLTLSVDKYLPVPREADKHNILLILVGKDKPGIISSISETLGKYKMNIEFAQTIGRADVFVMELLTDVRHATIPLENVKSTVQKAMGAKGIQTILQTENVFNKRKRLIVFSIAGSFMKPSLVHGILEQTGISAREVAAAYPSADATEVLRVSAGLLDGFPLEVLQSIIASITVNSQTEELIQTLKTMGYKVAVLTNALSQFSDALKSKLGIDYVYGVAFGVDDDAQSLCATSLRSLPVSDETQVQQIRAREEIDPEDVSVLGDENNELIPGIRVEFDLERLLGYYNNHVISKEAMIGLMGAFGIVARMSE